MPDSPNRQRPRTRHVRSPQPSPKRAREPFGGYSSEEADRHLMNYKTAFGDAEDDFRALRLTRSIIVTARRWRKIANDHLRQAGQSMARWETLFLVAFSGKGLPQTELARLIGVQGPTMVAMLNQLAQEGLINRYQSETDQRVTVNEITPAGLAAITDIMGITNVLRNELLAEIPREQQELCIDVLDAILNKLDRMR